VTGWTIIHEAERRGWSDPALTELRRIEALEEARADFADTMTEEEEAEIEALIYGTGDPAPAASGLTFLTPAQCATLPVRPYIVKGLIGQGDVTAIVGAPGAGKSLLAPRIAYAVAQGAEVFGRRTRQGGVFYVAAEDGHGMRSRLQALRKDHGEADALHLVGGVSDMLTKGGQFKALRAEVKARRPALVIIDTLAAAFPGLKENDPDGMGQVVAAARALTTWGAAVILIHHDTKAGDGLPRGHSILNGALDMALALTREGDVVTAKPSKNRNGTTETTLAFTIATRPMGKDEDGDTITAAIACEMDPDDVPRKSDKLPDSAAAAFAIFRDLAKDGRAVPDAVWREACVSGKSVSASEDSESRRKAFKRAVEVLSRRGLVAFHDGNFRLVHVQRETPTDWTEGFSEEGADE